MIFRLFSGRPQSLLQGSAFFFAHAVLCPSSRRIWIFRRGIKEVSIIVILLSLEMKGVLTCRLVDAGWCPLEETRPWHVIS